MKHLHKLSVMPALALVAACGGGGTDEADRIAASNEVMADANVMAPMSAEPAMSGQQFADTAAASDAYEVEAGKLASEKATSQALKEFGQMMVTAHTDSTAKLKEAAGRANPPVTPNPAMTAEQTENLAALRAASGDAFDAAYKQQQVAAHEKALAAMQGYAASGDVPEIKAFAAETAPVVQQHLEQIRGM